MPAGGAAQIAAAIILLACRWQHQQVYICTFKAAIIDLFHSIHLNLSKQEKHRGYKFQ